MSKLLVNAPSGAQEIIEVGEGGGYFDDARVLWDEREDGPLPAIALGGMVRQGGVLVFDQSAFDERTNTALATARAAAWERIKTELDRRKYLGVKVGAHWFHSDDPSRIQQLALAMMGNAIPAGLQWKTLTTTPPPVFVEMTPALAQGIFMATAASDVAIFAAAETHRVAMEAMSDPENYDCSGGWPARIEDAQ